MVDQKTLEEISVLLEKNGWKARPIRSADLHLLIHGNLIKEQRTGNAIKPGQTYMLSSYSFLGELLSVAPCFAPESEGDIEGILKMTENISKVPQIRTPLEVNPLQAFAVQFCEDSVVVTEVLPCCGMRQVPVSYGTFLKSINKSYRYDA